MNQLSEWARGCLLGLAVGDALGTTLEFTQRDSQPHHTEMLGGGFYDLKPGQWTDDTAMALALANSLTNCEGFNPKDVLDCFLAWLDSGDYSCTGLCFDIGNATLASLTAYRRTGQVSPVMDSAGNGSLMRLAPAVIFAKSRESAVRLAVEQSELTHGAAQAVQACQLFAEMLWDVREGADKEHVLRARNWEGDAAIAAIAAGAWKNKSRKEISSSGYVIHTLEAALWCISQAESFEQALIMAVNLGDDADTVGAVTGQLAGALWGVSSIPKRWLVPLAWKKDILKIADQLSSVK
ncbi:MAG: ADP-ribosylglycohydrolase family protein [Pelistega sp.]|nr:ADP-ribosylglycohydrolase family protein [Pelistega sp.]